MTNPPELRVVDKPVKLAGQPVTEPAVERTTILPLSLSEVSLKRDGQTLLKRITLAIEDQPVTAILGPNGAGKTLLLRVCHGLLVPDEGHVRWSVPSLAKSPRAQAMVFQRPVMLRRSVAENIEYAMHVCGLPRSERRARLQEALDASGLGRFAKRSALRLSGGEQQRLALARCVAVRPLVLFLDEPTAHLDPTATRQVEAMMVALRDAGTRLIVVTHDLGQARRLADRVLFMHRGRVLEQAEAGRFFEAPSSAEATAFLGGDLLW